MSLPQSDRATATYDTEAFPFRAWFENAMGTTELEFLHRTYNVTVDNIAQKVAEVRHFCEQKVAGLQELTGKFIISAVREKFGDILGWQEIPTIRFHFAVDCPDLAQEANDVRTLDARTFLEKYYLGGKRVAMFHRDKDYGLTPGSVNLWVPVTTVSGANSLWLGGPDLNGRDANPVSLNYGTALYFDGANRWHGTIWNTTPITRVSFDVRFLPKAHWETASRCSQVAAVETPGTAHMMT